MAGPVRDQLRWQMLPRTRAVPPGRAFVDEPDMSRNLCVVADLSRHQQKIVERYYDHRDSIMLTKLGELVTELMLASTDAARDRLWKRVATAMKNLKVPPKAADRILETRDPEALARQLRGWLSQARKT